MKVLRKIPPFFRNLASFRTLHSKKLNNENWDIFAAIALMRPAKIAPPMSKEEENFARVIKDIELEKSLLCNFELRQLQERRVLDEKAALELQGKIGQKLNEEIIVTADLKQEDWLKKAAIIRKKFDFENLTNLDDDKLNSLERKLDQQLVLIVKQKFSRKDGYASPWIIPQFQNKKGETLRQTAERCLRTITNGEIAFNIFSNAPFSVHSHKYAKNLITKIDGEAIGAKLFFYKATTAPQTQFGINNDEILDYRWVTAEEFGTSIISERYKRSLSTLFIDW